MTGSEKVSGFKEQAVLGPWPCGFPGIPAWPPCMKHFPKDLWLLLLLCAWMSTSGAFDKEERGKEKREKRKGRRKEQEGEKERGEQRA